MHFHNKPCIVHISTLHFHYAFAASYGALALCNMYDAAWKGALFICTVHLGMVQFNYAPCIIHLGMLQFDYAPCAIHLVIVQFHNEPCTNNLGIVQFNYTPCTIDNITTYFTQLLWTMHLGYCNSSLEHPSCKFLLSMVDNQNAPCTLV